MTHSKTHKKLSEHLNQPDALTNPEKYLGPNWQDVLNFWIYLDTLSEQEINQIADRYCALNYNVRKFAIIASRNAAGEVVGFEFRRAAWWSAWNVTGWGVFARATVELIGSHKLLKRNKTLTFLPLCIKS